MEIKTEKQGKVMVVALKGRLDATTAGELETTFSKLVGKSEVILLVDFKELEYISSAGLRVLLTVAKQVKKLSGNMGIAALNENVGQVFEISGFTTIFPIYTSTEEGLKEFNI